MKSLVDLIRPLKADETLTLESGRSYKGGTLKGKREPFRVAGYGASITDGFKLEECALATLENLLFPSSPSYGLMIVHCAGFVGRGLVAERAKITGFLTANTSDVLFDGCTASRSQQQHGFYLSQGGDRLRVRNCVADTCQRAGIQINAVGGKRSPDPNFDSVSTDVELIGNTIRDCQKSGAGSIQLMGVHGGLLSGNIVDGALGRWAVELFDDDAGVPFFCRDIEIDGTNAFGFAQGVKVAAVINANKGCQNIRVARGLRLPHSIPQERLAVGPGIVWV